MKFKVYINMNLTNVVLKMIVNEIKVGENIPDKGRPGIGIALLNLIGVVIELCLE